MMIGRVGGLDFSKSAGYHGLGIPRRIELGLAIPQYVIVITQAQSNA